MRRALARAKDMGFDHYYLGPELEFFLFKSDEGTEVLDKGGYFDLTTLDVASDFRRDCVFTLRELGIPVEYTHHEVGPSQHEIDMRFADGLEMADNTMTYRIAIKEVAAKHGYYATFMPKPLFGENGSGMHTHQSLFRGEENAFFDGDDEYYLSDEAKGFIAGQLRHARELSALFAPSVNSYKRLVPGLRGAGVHRLVAAQPLRARAGAGVPPRQGEGDADGAPLPGSVVQPLPDVRGAAARGPRGDREGLRAPGRRSSATSTTSTRRTGSRMGISHLPESLGEAIEEMAHSELVERALGAAHLLALRRPQARGVGRLPRAGHAVGDRALPGDQLQGLALPATPRGAHLEMVGAVLAGDGLERVAEIASAYAGAPGGGDRAAAGRARGEGGVLERYVAARLAGGRPQRPARGRRRGAGLLGGPRSRRGPPAGPGQGPTRASTCTWRRSPP